MTVEHPPWRGVRPARRPVPQPPAVFAWLRDGIFAAGWMLLVVLLAVARHRGAGGTDVSLLRWWQSLPLGPLGSLLQAYSWLGEGKTPWLLLGSVLLVMVGLRWFREVVTLLLAQLIIPVAGLVAAAEGRVRPPDGHPGLVARGGFGTAPSLPSGHVVFWTVLFGLLMVFLVHRSRSSAARAAALSAFGAGLLLMPLARTWIGAEWPSDAALSLLLGLMWLWTMYLLFRWVGARLR